MTIWTAIIIVILGIATGFFAVLSWWNANKATRFEIGFINAIEDAVNETLAFNGPFEWQRLAKGWQGRDHWMHAGTANELLDLDGQVIRAVLRPDELINATSNRLGWLAHWAGLGCPQIKDKGAAS